MKLIYLIFCIFLLGSCMKPSIYDKVIDYYSNDSLKKEAASFLKEYSQYHYGIARNIVDSTGKKSSLSPIMFASDTLYRTYLDEHHYSLKIGKPVMDEDTITEIYLKNNIEQSFDSWNRPWAKNVSFHDFCHYILPYRNNDEELSNWRSYFKDKYEHLILDSMKENCTTLELAEFLMRQIKKNVDYGTHFNGLIQGCLTPKETEKLGHVECKACANYATMVMRACGIPCELIEIHWRFTECAHSSILFPQTGNNPKPFRLNIGDALTFMGEAKDTMASYRTWAYTYEVNNSLLRLKKDKNVPKSYLNPLCRADRTALLSKTYDFHMPLPKEAKGKQHLFLCRFHEWKWYPIREGFVEGNNIIFKDATIRQLYRLGYANNGKIKTFGNIFTILGDGKIQPYNQCGEKLHFKIAFSCDSTETESFRKITTYYWDKSNKWQATMKQAPLWGFNKVTGEYKLFQENMRGKFIPVFHLYEIELPMWTAFYNKELPRPIGFISKDPNTNEGYMMQF